MLSPHVFLALPTLFIQRGGVLVCFVYLSVLLLVSLVVVSLEIILSKWLERPVPAVFDLLPVSWHWMRYFFYSGWVVLMCLLIWDTSNLVHNGLEIVKTGSLSWLGAAGVPSRSMSTFRVEQLLVALCILGVIYLHALLSWKKFKKALGGVLILALLCLFLVAVSVLDIWGWTGVWRMWGWRPADFTWGAFASALELGTVSLGAGIGLYYWWIEKERDHDSKNTWMDAHLWAVFVPPLIVHAVMLFIFVIVASPFAYKLNSEDISLSLLMFEWVPRLLRSIPYSFISLEVLYWVGLSLLSYSYLSILGGYLIGIFSKELGEKKAYGSFVFLFVSGVLLFVSTLPNPLYVFWWWSAEWVWPVSILFLCGMVSFYMPKVSRKLFWGRGLFWDRLYKFWDFLLRWFVPACLLIFIFDRLWVFIGA